MGDFVKRVRVLNRVAFFAEERYLFSVFFFASFWLFLLLFGKTGPTFKLCRVFGKRGRRGRNEISFPPPRANKEFFLALKERSFRRNHQSVAHRAMREPYSCRVFARYSSSFLRVRVRDLMKFGFTFCNCFGEMK